MQLDGPWRFQMGDDPRWADPAFDDSAWPTVMLGKTLADQGFDAMQATAGIACGSIRANCNSAARATILPWNC